jgi:hypothetical protein
VSVQNQLAVQELLAVRAHHGVALFGAEGFLVKVHASKSVADDQMGNKLVLSMHVSSYFEPS